VQVAEEWRRKIHPILRGIVEDAEDYATVYPWEFFVTCIMRTPAENDACYGGKGDHLDGVHVEGRGIDIRTRDVDEWAVKGLVGYVNNRFIYDPERPKMKVALYEPAGYGSTAQHLHLQAHPRTRMAYMTEED